MKVLGVGTDVVDIPTFTEQLRLPGSQLREVFTSRERRRARQRAEEAEGDEHQHLAAAWALKEAFIKAWSGALSGVTPPLGRDQVSWPEIEVRHDLWGRPSLSLTGAVRDWVARSVGAVRLHVSASHDGDFACALVVLEQDQATGAAAG